MPRPLDTRLGRVEGQRMAAAAEPGAAAIGPALRAKAAIDGGYFGGYVKPAKHVENRRDRRLRQYQSGKRKDVVVIREREARHCLALRPQASSLSDLTRAAGVESGHRYTPW